MKDWLKKRLTPKKQQEDRWVGLAESIQTQWEEEFDPSLTRLENLRSYFRAHDEDLAKKLREMGDYFAADMPKAEDKPIAVAWRRLELEYKDLELILSSVFRRHYADLPVTWFPLFAPIDEIYGSQFQAAQGPWPERKNAPPDGWFLTSRGLLGTDYGHLLSIGLLKQEYIDKAMPLLLRTKPLHIVLDGLLWYIRFDIPFDACIIPETVWWERNCGLYELQFSVLGSRFDYTAADARDLDIQSALCTWDRINLCDIPFIPMNGRIWHLDFYLPEDLSKDGLPADTIIAGWENIKSPFTLVAGIWNKNFSIYTDANEISTTYHKQKFHFINFDAKADNFIEVKESSFIMEADFDDMGRLDRYPRFDDFPADKLPLDMPIGGVYA